MKNIKIADVTLRESAGFDSTLSFKDRIAIARKSDELMVDIIETAKITNYKTDVLYLHTIIPLLKNSIISVGVELSEESIEKTWDAIKDAKKARLNLQVPTSTVQMEYICHKKPPKVLEMIEQLTKKCADVCDDVEFSALDATRSESEFLYKAIKCAIDNGAKTITICDSAGTMLPVEFEEFLTELQKNVDFSNVTLSVECSNSMHMATACAISSVKSGATQIKTCYTNEKMPALESIADVFNLKGDQIKAKTNLAYTKLGHNLSQMDLFKEAEKLNENENNNLNNSVKLSKTDDIKTVSKFIAMLGYDLSDDDIKNVYEAFLKVAEKKTVGKKELDAIIANEALQVPPTFKTIDYVINSGNIINSTAQITINKNGENVHGFCIGDGPIDAAFKAIEQIIGCHYELDDFQISAITEGREALGSAIVKLRAKGKLYSGKGVSTDIIGASIFAYVNAVNKICFEQA